MDIRRLATLQMSAVPQSQGRSTATTALAAPQDAVALGQRPEPDVALSNAQLARLFSVGTAPGPTPPAWEHAAPSDSEEVRMLVQSNDGSLFARSRNTITRLDGANGTEAWPPLQLASSLRQDTCGLFACGQGSTLLAATEDNRLRGLDPATGSEKWSFDQGAKFNHPAQVASNGDILTFRKHDDELHFCRLSADGTSLQDVRLGHWSKPLGQDGDKSQIVLESPDGSVIVHGSVRVRTPGETFAPMYNETFAIAPDGSVTAEVRTLEPSVSFPGDPQHFYAVDYQSMGAWDRADGHPVWTLEKKHTINDPKYGPCGDTLFELGGEFQYKSVKLADASGGRLLVQGYIEKNGQSGEELLCLDPTDPSKALWKHPTQGSVFHGPLYTSPDLLIHVKSSDSKEIEALDPATGKELWSLELGDPVAGQRLLGQGGGGFGRRTVGINSQFQPVSKEIADNFKVVRGQDNTLFVRTYRNVFALDATTGTIRSVVRSEHELDDFAISPQQDMVYVVDAETNAVRAFPFETPERALERQVKEAAAEQASNGPTPGIEVTEQEVVIAGVHIRRNTAPPPQDGWLVTP